MGRSCGGRPTSSGMSSTSSPEVAMAARPQLAVVLVLALVLVIGLAGIFLWGGLGPEEDLPADPGTTTQTAGDVGADAGSLKADAGVEGDLLGDTDRENIQPPPGTAAPKLVLTGRLVRSDNTPGAGLTLRYLNFGGGLLLRGANLRNFADAPAIKTDTDGRFRVDAAAESMGYLGLDGTEAVFNQMLAYNLV